MSKKTYNLVIGIVGGVAAIASAIVTFCVPGGTGALIVGAIGIGSTAVCEICNLFVKGE